MTVYSQGTSFVIGCIIRDTQEDWLFAVNQIQYMNSTFGEGLWWNTGTHLKDST